MRVLHLVKTSSGARWAALQARVLRELGIEVHVVLPSIVGATVAEWERAGVRIHVSDVSLPVRRPWLWPSVANAIRRLVGEVKPDLIHSHFVTNTLALRLALGVRDGIPRLFQVPGPLHLEHPLLRTFEIGTAGGRDFWIASSRYTQRLYWEHGVSRERVFLSYYGSDMSHLQLAHVRTLRERLGLTRDQWVVGNISHMYPPKYLLGQTTGLKRHEDVIDALGIASRKQPDIVGVLVGGQWSGGTWYERRLQRLARRAGGGRIILLGHVPFDVVPQLWCEFDCAVHVPISENCGGVVEPLAAGVPTIASRVGGLPEVVHDGLTGWLVPAAAPTLVAETMLQVLADTAEAKRRAHRGQELVRVMFDVRRTAGEVARIYEHVLYQCEPAPAEFDSAAAAKSLAEVGHVA